MLLRSYRFYLSGYLHYYEHLRLPQQQSTLTVPLGSPTFMCNLRTARNIILLRVPVDLLFTVASINIAGFTNSGSLTDTILRNEA